MAPLETPCLPALVVAGPDREQIVAAVVHEYNNVLGVILVSHELLRRRLREPGDAEDLALIGRAARRAADLTRELTALTRQCRAGPESSLVGEVARPDLIDSQSTPGISARTFQPMSADRSRGAEMTMTGADAITVVIVDDHRMFAESLARLLSDEPDIAVVGRADNGAEAISLVTALRPRVVLLDHQLPGGDGISIALQLKKRDPDLMVVMLTASADERVLVAALDAGCSGFLTKDRAAADVADAVRAAAAGEVLLPMASTMGLLPQTHRSQRSIGSDLTEREKVVLVLLAHGRTNKAIAAELFLSVNTVRNYVQSVLTKLDSHSKLEALSVAVGAGIIDYPGSR